MKTPASIQSHPVHAMLVALPLGLWIFSFICDVLYQVYGAEDWRITAFLTMGGGIVTALAASVPGLMDYLYVRNRNESVKKIGAFHLGLNLAAVLLYAVNFYLRLQLPGDHKLPIALSAAAILILTISGWLGGEMVYVHRVGVEEKEEAVHSAMEKSFKYR
ncbi:MAG: DUF2231 domain-containing protein [Candidatus Omnitrophica bacterium]|nr:DUF2231 domain-containing protein [Candidatus Omnitrophota bacterium]